MSEDTHLLIADDDAGLRLMLAELLADAGYRVDQAGSGLEALSRLQGDQYDLLLTDITMPGMDGITLVRQALSLDRHLAAVLVTGLADRQTAVEALKLGAHDFIVKPFNADELLHAVEAALDRRRLALSVEAYERELEQKVED